MILKILPDNKLVMHQSAGTGKLDDKEFEFGLIIPFGLYFKCKDKMVVTDSKEFCREAMKLIEESFNVSTDVDSKT